VIKNKHLFYTNDEIHSIHTRFKTNLHPPIANLTKFQKGVYYSAIRNFNNLHHNVKDLANEIILSLNALKWFLLINSFYNSEEYLIIKDNPLKTDGKLKTGFRRFIICTLLIRFSQYCVYYIRQYVYDYVCIHRIVPYTGFMECE